MIALVVAGSTLAFARPGRPPAGLDPDVWTAQLAQIAACGFAHVDLVSGWVSPATLSGSQLDDLRGSLDAAGLAATGISLVRASVIDPADADANLELTLGTLEAAAALGVGLVSIGFHRPLQGPQLQGPFWMAPAPQDAADEANFTDAIARLHTICARAAQLDIAISLELHEGTLLDRGARVRRILDGVDAPNLGVNLDLGNLVRVPGPLVEPWQETLAACLGRINYWHVKNYLRLEQPATGLALSAPCTVADGEIDYRTAIEQAVDAGYRGPLCIEHYGGDPLWAMAQGRAYLTSLPPVT